jgi:Delta14-sterol reductase
VARLPRTERRYSLDCSQSAILTTMDITTDGFGFMLAFGDLAWVPFTYSLQARYLATRDISLSTTELAVVVLLQLFGYYIFRSANGQKDDFRRDPTLPQFKGMQSGWVLAHRGPTVG